MLFNFSRQDLMGLATGAAMVIACNAAAQPPGAANKTANTSAPVCGEMSDHFCNTLWDASHSGNIEVLDGQIALGKSKKSGESLRLLTDLRTLAGSTQRLPSDLSVRAAPILKSLGDLLDEEAKPGPWDNDQKFEWQTQLALVRAQFAALRTRVQHERFKTLFPDLAAKDDDDLTVSDLLKWMNLSRDLNNEILDAKYKNHPNWLRVVNLFEEVRTRLLSQASRLPVSPEQKAFMVSQLKAIRLSLPYPDPRRTGADANCASTTLNAFYDPSRNVYTVCAGWFNSSQSKTALFQVTAHEISHSIDPETTADHFWRTKSPTFLTLHKLAGMTDQAQYTCTDWQQIKADVTSQPAAGPTAYNGLEKLYRCLAPKKLDPYNPADVAKLARNAARGSIGSDADNSNYLRLAEPAYLKHGVMHASEYFLRPDVIFESLNGFDPYPGYQLDAESYDVYAQDLLCQRTDTSASARDIRQMNEDERAVALKTSAQATLDIVASVTADFLSYCGQNCAGLASSGMATSASEAFADWMAGQVITGYLATFTGLEAQRSAASVLMAPFCTEPGPEHEAPATSTAQKAFSLEAHPENRQRRLSIFTPATAALIRCNVKAGEEGFGSCAP